MLIAFEGIDGSGKTVQSITLKKRLEEQGLNCTWLSFPVYETNVGQLIFDHLHDKKQAFALDPRVVSILYAANRLEMRPRMLQALNKDHVMICNRYSYSNVAFQGAKVPPEERIQFISWIEELEFETFQLPRPNLVVLLLLPPSKAARFITAKKSKTEEGADQYERNQAFLEDVYAIYQKLSDSRDNWISIHCCSEKEAFSKKKVAELVATAVIPRIEQYCA